MISLDEIEREIRELEARGDTTYSLCERLAWLYIVRDHIREGDSGVSFLNGNRTGNLHGSEFLEACAYINFADMMQIIDAHMEAIKIVCPKEYDSVLSRIRSLKMI